MAGESMNGYVGFEKLSLSIKMNIYISLEKEMATVSSSLLNNSMDRGAQQTTVHGVTKELHKTE